MKKVSVIVPVYNMEKYLSECLDSLVNQTYKNIEIILIDDGSTDSSYDICTRYAEKNKNIIIRKKKNGGGGSARNIALDIATGDYIIFVDSDDWIVQDACEQLMDLANKHDADVIHCEVFKEVDKKNVPVNNEETVLLKKEILETMLNDRVRSGALKMFKKEVVGDCRFPLDSSIDDMVFFSAIIERVNVMVITNKELYYYRYNRVDSMSNSSSRFVKNVYERFEEFILRHEIAKRNGVYGDEAFKKAVEHGLVFLAHYEVKAQWLEQRRRVRKYICSNRKHIYSCPIITNKDKFKCRILCLSEGLFMLAVKLNAVRSKY